MGGQFYEGLLFDPRNVAWRLWQAKVGTAGVGSYWRVAKSMASTNKQCFNHGFQGFRPSMFCDSGRISSIQSLIFLGNGLAGSEPLCCVGMFSRFPWAVVDSGFDGWNNSRMVGSCIRFPV